MNASASLLGMLITKLIRLRITFNSGRLACHWSAGTCSRRRWTGRAGHWRTPGTTLWTLALRKRQIFVDLEHNRHYGNWQANWKMPVFMYSDRKTVVQLRFAANRPPCEQESWECRQTTGKRSTPVCEKWQVKRKQASIRTALHWPNNKPCPLKAMFAQVRSVNRHRRNTKGPRVQTTRKHDTGCHSSFIGTPSARSREWTRIPLDGCSLSEIEK